MLMTNLYFILKMSSAEETFVGSIDEGSSSTRFMVNTFHQLRLIEYNTLLQL